ncbi:MAG: hypothetical protein II852_09095 [Bacteroidales bacterium]|nr:hypothetical protein [Bacteroidales bacterium]
MKRTLLTILPVAAALLLATSCSKDTDDNIIVNNPTPAETQKDASPAESKTVPFSIDVVPGGSLSKIAYADDGTTVTVKFVEADITDGLTMSVTDGTHSTTLTLTAVDVDGKGTFTGSWNEGEEPSDGVKITATVAYKSGSTVVNSTESVKKLMEICAHNYKGTFNYQTSGGNSVTLTDDRAYIEFTLAEGQKKVFVNGQWYDVGQTTHKAYVAVEGNTEVTTRIKGNKTLKAGKIYTITCTDVVDLGPTFSVLWKTTNETGGTVLSSYSQSDAETSVYKDEKYCEWANACAFGRIKSDEYEKGTADPFRLPTKAELEALGSGTWKTKNSMNGREFSTDYGSVFFPAAGLNSGTDASYEGFYWSGESYGDNFAYVLYFNDSYAHVRQNDAYGLEFSVRLVRGL